jgi:hypothetical protein
MASMRANIRSYAAASAGKNDMSIVITAALRDQPDTIRATIRAIWVAIASAMIR